MSKQILNRAAILANKTLKTQTVEVPEWNGEVIIRELTAAKAMELGANVKKDDRDAMVSWVVASTVDDAGNLLFTDEDKALLGEMSAAAILRIGNAAVKLSGFGDEEAVAKN